ncbi:hypothetical protein [Paenibacillus polymyxa]|uniref:hypothetical protein n=1 Tax=Paenibacillus polymyxa TaxID=1406 RepID=UPI001867FE8E|nr:hypothetical protein [Paenibacillus polymyxa]MBE3649164.1 hypothetical protein [Paenibacillus polymyxa]
MTKQTYREANVGERIKIVNPQFTHGYGKDDEGSVTETRTSGVFAQINGRRRGVYHEEYVVLEPVTSVNVPDISEAFTQFIRDNADTIRAILGDVTKPEPAELTRAAVIEKARADVAELTRKMRSGNANWEGNYTFSQDISKPEFYVNRDKRVVTALVRGIYGNEILEKGIAKAAPDDVFHAEIGTAIALRRALGLTVPSEYTDAPKPTEKLANMLIRCVSGETRKLTDSTADFNVRNCSMLHSWNGRNGIVIDDTDVDYSVVMEGAAA